MAIAYQVRNRSTLEVLDLNVIDYEICRVLNTPQSNRILGGPRLHPNHWNWARYFLQTTYQMIPVSSIRTEKEFKAMGQLHPKSRKVIKYFRDNNLEFQCLGWIPSREIDRMNRDANKLIG
jgi:hypothetical protein